MHEARHKPVAEFKAGTVRATVWMNEIQKDGKPLQLASVSVERSFKDGETWKKTNSFRADDLPKVVAVAWKAYELLVLKGRTPAAESGPE